MSVLGWGVIALALAHVFWTWAGYPLFLALIRPFARRPVRAEDVAPSLCVVIAVFDGERDIARKLEDTLALGYPRAFDVIVASDGSTDRTDDIVRGFAPRGVRLVRSEPRQGKETAQAAAIAQASAEVIVFTDVSAELEPQALSRIVRPFADPAIGCVSSEDRVDSSGGEGAYVRYEMALRRLESEVTTLIGCSGSFFAVRRSLCTPWPGDLASDFRIALEAARRGLRAVSEPTARARFRATDDPAAEWARKVRTVRRGIAVLSAYRDVLHPRFGGAALSLWSHKALRFTAPFALLGLLAASALLATQSGLATLLLGAQIAFYGAGTLALLSRATARLVPARLAGFFLLVNLSALVAWRHHCAGERAVLWAPTRR